MKTLLSIFILSTALLLTPGCGINTTSKQDNKTTNQQETQHSERQDQKQETKINKQTQQSVTKIAITALDGTTLAASITTPKIGCDDKIYFIETNQNLTPQTALETMFTYQPQNQDAYNVFSNSQITIDSITINNNTAQVSLLGNLYTGGVCDSPRTSEQIEKTLTQFNNINKVEITINNQQIQDYLSEK